MNTPQDVEWQSYRDDRMDPITESEQAAETIDLKAKVVESEKSFFLGSTSDV